MEESIAVTIALGAVSGVVASWLLWLLKYLFTDKFLPFYRAAVYKGSSIQGTWVAYEYEDGVRQRPLATLIVNQFAHSIDATYTMHFESGDNLLFHCEGEYWEGYLSMRGRSNIQTNYNILTALLRLIDNGAVMRGDVSFRHRAKDEPFTMINCMFERQ